MQMMEVFILKFQYIAEFQIPELFGRWYVRFSFHLVRK